MNTREKIIQVLEENKGRYVSGERLAESFGLSRNAIWKSINELKTAGYPIESVRNKGYMLSKTADIISKAGIVQYLRDKVNDGLTDDMTDKLYVYEDLDSTNTQALREIVFDRNEVLHKTVIVAKRQSMGRGHQGTGFDSPAGGIYLSIILDPKKLISTDPITKKVSEMTIDTVEGLYKVKIDKKKDSSLYVGKEKICGILTEAVSDLETGTYSCFIVGIGIRSDMLRRISARRPSKNLVIATLLAKFAEL